MSINNKIVTGICGVAAAAVIGTGGYLATTSGSSAGSPSGPAQQVRDDTVTLGDDGAYLDAAVAAADGPAPAAPEATPSPGDRGPRLARHPLRARRFLRGLHGTATVRTKGGFAEVAWQRGQVTAVSSSGLTVRSADGASWQWVTGSSIKVRKDGKPAKPSELAANDKIFVIGTVSGSTRTARAAVVPKAR
ncbi:MAG TPA: hypothetical protein VF069_01935 [Streptosporangiaceae bacterium]